VISGSATIGIEQYVFINGEFAFRQGDDIESVTVPGTAGAVFVNGLTVGAENVNIFVGTGYDLTAGFDAQTDLVGLKITNAFFGLGLFKEVVSASDKTANVAGLSFTVLNAGGDVALVGGDGLTVEAYNLEVLYNAGSGGNAIDFSGAPLTIATSETGSVNINVASTILAASGFLVIGIEEYVYLAGNISFTKGGTLTTATKEFDVTQISGSGISAFVVTGGP
jgi:hypothetical protein